jgi:uncharacterized protein (TIGR03089 family)
MSALVDTDPPLLTYYDDATGERTSLTAVELGSWAARTSALLQSCGLGPGARAAVLLPPHWQTAAVLLGAWSAGLTVQFRPFSTAGLEPADPADVVFVSPERIRSWLDEVPPAPHRFVVGAPSASGVAVHASTPDDEYRDFLAEVSRFPAHTPSPALTRPSDPASVDGTTYRQWGTVASGVAERLSLASTDRVLVEVEAHEHPVNWLLAPLAVGASVVLCANLDPAIRDARMAEEHVTRLL